MPRSSPNASTSNTAEMIQEAVIQNNPPVQPAVSATTTITEQPKAVTAAETIQTLLTRSSSSAQSLKQYVATAMNGQTPTAQLLFNYHSSSLLSTASTSSSPLNTSSNASTPTTTDPDSPPRKLNLPYLFPGDIRLIFDMFRRDMDMCVQPALEAMSSTYGFQCEAFDKLTKEDEQKAAKITEQEATIKRQAEKIAEQSTKIDQHEGKIKEAVANHLQQQEKEFEAERAKWEIKEKILEQQIVDLKEEKNNEQLVLLNRITDLEQEANKVDHGLLAEKTRMAARLDELEQSSAKKYERIATLEDEGNKKDAENLELSNQLMTSQQRLNYLEAEKAEVDKFVLRRVGLIQVNEQQPSGQTEFTFNAMSNSLSSPAGEMLHSNQATVVSSSPQMSNQLEPGRSRQNICDDTGSSRSSRSRKKKKDRKRRRQDRDNDESSSNKFHKDY